MQYFTRLSQKQKEAVGKPCAKCHNGTYRERNGRYGPWVQCDNWLCKAKVYRPRGAWVARGKVEIGNQVVTVPVVTVPNVVEQDTAEAIESSKAPEPEYSGLVDRLNKLDKAVEQLTDVVTKAES